MRSAARAIGWEFWQRHRWPFFALLAWQLLLAVARIVTGGPATPIRLDPPDGWAAMVIAPLSLTYFYYIAVFSYGLAGDLGARESPFPARMRTLPVPTAALAFWPMLYGSATAMLMWWLAALFARWPWGLTVPVVWPALMAAAFLAWTQALAWMPYGLRNIRVVVTVLWLALIDAVVIAALHFRVGEPVMIALVAPQLVLAYLVARAAVARARRGDTPDWRPFVARWFSWAGSSSVGASAPWTPARAQAWFEWRRLGRSLPTLVAMVLPFELALLGLAHDAPALVFELLELALLTPLVMASFVSTSVSAANANAREALALTPFMATRPITSAALIAAKLRMATRSVLMTWALVVIAIPIALTATDTWPTIITWRDKATHLVGAPHATVFALLVLAALLLTTWTQLVQGLAIGLSGRVWLIRTRALLTLLLVVFIGPVLQWVAHRPVAQTAIWNAIPATLTLLVALKLGGAAWVAGRLSLGALISDRALRLGAASWVAIVLALSGVFGWLLSGPLIPQYLLTLVAILAIPLARVSAAPLALDASRHR